MKTVRAYKHVCLYLLECCSFCMKHHPHPPPLRVQYAAVSLQQRNGKAGMMPAVQRLVTSRVFSGSFPYSFQFRFLAFQKFCDARKQSILWKHHEKPLVKNYTEREWVIGVHEHVLLSQYSVAHHQKLDTVTLLYFDAPFFFYKNSYLIRILRLKFVKF